MRCGPGFDCRAWCGSVSSGLEVALLAGVVVVVTEAVVPRSIPFSTYSTYGTSSQ